MSKPKPSPMTPNPWGVRWDPSRKGETWLDPEHLAYTNYSGAPTGSPRRGYVRFPDGKLRLVRLGVPDTYFSIPAKPSHGRIGFVSFSEDKGEYVFHAYTDCPVWGGMCSHGADRLNCLACNH